MSWKKLTPSEHQIQSSYFDWVRSMEHQDDRYKMILAIPNAAKRSYALAARMKKEGLKAGVWDVLIAVPQEPYACAWMEFKASPKKKLTKEQIEFCAYAARYQGLMMIAYTFEEAKEYTENYFNRTGLANIYRTLEEIGYAKEQENPINNSPNPNPKESL